jgi:hypothetical protein
MARFQPRPTYANVVSTLCLVIVLGGSAVAADSLSGAGSSSSQQIYVCVKKSGKGKGQMRVVSQRSRCKRTERKTQWAVQGPPGPAGPAGAPGTAGASSEGSLVPSGAVGFYALSQCPAGWSTYDPARGRYVVGLDGGGALEGPVGTKLDPGENRAIGQHTHPLNDPGHRHQVTRVSPIIRAGNVTPVRIQGTATVSQQQDLPNTPGNESIALSTTGVTLDPAGGVPGTNAPYVQLLPCKKD